MPLLAGSGRLSVSALSESFSHRFVCSLTAGLPGREPIDVAIVHAEGCRNQNGIVYVQIARAVLTRLVDKLGCDSLCVSLNVSSDLQQRFEFRGDVCSRWIAADCIDKLWASANMMGGCCTMACLAEVTAIAR